MTGGIPLLDITGDIKLDAEKDPKTGDDAPKDTDNKIKMMIKMSSDTSEKHGDYKGHPKLSMSMTLQCWKRGELSLEKAA